MAEKGFDASKYLTRVEGRDYLKVKWRLLWLRTEHPEAAIQTDLVEHREGYALGYGTQFCEDFAFREEAESYVVDAPVSMPEPRTGRTPRAGSGTATEAQVKAIHAIARHDYEWDEAEIDRRVSQALGMPTTQLSKQQASRLIDELKAKTFSAAPQGGPASRPRPR
ncbi:MAG: hypothetical protein EXR51_01905 [Dehalococcoidia bacterium]|nr:hypothetical protein [Dehalococcoidia bacterium]